MTVLAATTIVEGLSPAQRETIEKLYRGVAGAFDLLDGVVTPDWLDIPIAPGQIPGPDAVTPHVAAFHRVLRGVSIVSEGMIGVNGHTAVRAEITGAFVGEWMGVAGASKECVIRIHESH